MSPDLVAFAEKYRRFLRVFGMWVACVPGRWRPASIFALGRWLSPFGFQAGKFVRSVQSVLPEIQADGAWRDWLNSHVQFTLDFFSYQSLDAAWLANDVVVADAALLASLRESGGLLLTYHSHHQNTLCCALGIAGVKVSAIAALPEDSPLFSYIGRWAKRVNSESAKHFRGGTYIFTDNLRQLLQVTRKRLASHEVVVCLCDFHQPGAGTRSSGRLFDRSISPPTGTIQLAIKHGVPIFTALFAPLNGKLVLTLKRLDESGGVDAIVGEYFSFLESSLRINPACWQGWEWFDDLPLAN